MNDTEKAFEQYMKSLAGNSDPLTVPEHCKRIWLAACAWRAERDVNIAYSKSGAPDEGEFGEAWNDSAATIAETIIQDAAIP